MINNIHIYRIIKNILTKLSKDRNFVIILKKQIKLPRNDCQYDIFP